MDTIASPEYDFTHNLITDRNEYFRQKAIEQQNHIVNFAQCATRTSEALVWTYRTTNCDVISVITTSTITKEGKMRDIHIRPQEVKRLGHLTPSVLIIFWSCSSVYLTRLKPPSIKLAQKDLLGNSPYDIGLSVDVVKKTKKMNQLLHQEKKEFMAKLNVTRFVRSKLELDATTKIQAIYRGYYVRKNFGEIRHYLVTNSMIRANIRSFLNHHGYATMGLARYTKERQALRHFCATLIQTAFRCLLSRKCLRRLKYDRKQLKRVQAALVIQARVRGISSRARVKALIEKRRIILYRLSVIKIQAALRGMFGRRKVWRRRYRLYVLAARIIQSWYRAKYSRRMANHIKHIMHLRRTNRGALMMQKVVRRFLSVRRVARIRLRRLHVLIFTWVTRIQCLVRKFLARVNTGKRRRIVRDRLAEEKRLQEESEMAQLAAKLQAENRALLDSADIYLQAREGNTVGVEDIFKGLMGGEPLQVTDTNADGDTLLTIAAAYGNVDLLRKCILWGFDVNHRNNEGLTAIMVAAKANHLSAFQYLLSFYKSSEVATPEPVDTALQTDENKAEEGGNVPLSSESAESVVEGDASPPVAVDVSKKTESSTADGPILLLEQEDIGFLLVTAAANAAIADLTMLQALLLQGFDVNTPSQAGMTAIHAICEIGHVEGFKLLSVKFKAKIEGLDELGQSPLHKASSSSLQIVQWILGLDPEFHTYMSEQSRLSSIQTPDGDGKDCLLIAALSGQSEILELMDGIVSAAGSSGLSKRQSRLDSHNAENESDEISWSPQDISKTMQLVSSGNIFCLHRVLESGFELDWQQEEDGLTMALAASSRGDIDVANLLLQRGADFSLVDSVGRNCMHYAALHGQNASEFIAHLLSHPAAGSCRVTKALLIAADSDGNTPFHLAAEEGTEINVDLLAAEIFPEVLNIQNKKGMTPLSLACSNYHEKLTLAYLRLGADALTIDESERSCLWHIFHPKETILSTRRPLCSEYMSVSGLTSPARKDKDEEVVRVGQECAVVVALLKAGCTLYTEYGRTPEEMLRLPNPVIGSPQISSDPSSEPGDVALQECAMTLFKSIIPSIISPLDAWRLCKYSSSM